MFCFQNRHTKLLPVKHPIIALPAIILQFSQKCPTPQRLSYVMGFEDLQENGFAQTQTPIASFKNG